MLQIIPTAFDAEDWLKATGAKSVQLWMEVSGGVGYFDEEVQQIDIDSPDGCWVKVKYPSFFWWRFKQVFDDSEEFLEITPNMMDGYFKEPKDPTQTRCPRCLSTNVTVGYPYIECKNCGYNEPLIDFPISQYFHLALLQEENERQMRSRSSRLTK